MILLHSFMSHAPEIALRAGSPTVLILSTNLDNIKMPQRPDQRSSFVKMIRV